MKAEAENRIKNAPIPAFFAGVIIGVLITVFRYAVFWLFFLGAAGLAVLWLMSDAGGRGGCSNVVEVPPSDPGNSQE